MILRPHLIPIGKHSDPLAASEPDDRVELDDSIARLRMELGKQFEGAWAEGREMSLGEAQALASS